jgi:hypothetical protein
LKKHAILNYLSSGFEDIEDNPVEDLDDIEEA